MDNKIRVLIVDDSALVRKMLAEILVSDGTIEVVGAAPDPYVAREMIKERSPDVVTLDVEMPRMDGITFLRNLMRLRPTPVVMVSTLTAKGADVTLDALELGAIDYVTKPKIDLACTLEDYSAEIISKVKIAANSKSRLAARASVGSTSRSAVAVPKVTRGFRTTDRLIAIGASTGGTEAIKEVLATMPADSPACVITQHIPEAFSGPFAERMDRHSAMTVCEAQDGMQIVTGHAYIAPGNRHLSIEKSGARWVCRLLDTGPVNRHRPSVDVMMASVAASAGKNAVGVMLTGMGADGANGLKAMHDIGAWTIAQDEKTSVVWGMPGSAVRAGAVDEVLPLDRIAGAMLEKALRNERT